MYIQNRNSSGHYCFCLVEPRPCLHREGWGVRWKEGSEHVVQGPGTLKSTLLSSQSLHPYHLPPPSTPPTHTLQSNRVPLPSAFSSTSGPVSGEGSHAQAWAAGRTRGVKRLEGDERQDSDRRRTRGQQRVTSSWDGGSAGVSTVRRALRAGDTAENNVDKICPSEIRHILVRRETKQNGWELAGDSCYGMNKGSGQQCPEGYRLGVDGAGVSEVGTCE